MEVCLEVSGTLKVEECVSDAELDTLRSAWNTLWSQCPRATPFQSPEWLIPWWRHLGKGELWVLAIRQEDQLVGLAALCIDENRATVEGTVLFLGTGIND